MSDFEKEDTCSVCLNVRQPMSLAERQGPHGSVEVVTWVPVCVCVGGMLLCVVVFECVCVRETEEENLMLVDLNLAGFPKHVSC